MLDFFPHPATQIVMTASENSIFFKVLSVELTLSFNYNLSNKTAVPKDRFASFSASRTQQNSRIGGNQDWRQESMTGWQNEKLHALRFINNDRAMFQKIAEWAKELGFEYCTFTMRVPVPVSKPPTFAATNYPEAWQKAYVSNNFVNIDPVVRHGLRSEEMLVWSDELFKDTLDFWKAAQETGLCHGISIPTRGCHGIIGLLSLARPTGTITPKELADIEFKLTWLGQIAHQGMSKHLAINTTISGGLTKREIVVLYWTAEGKTASDIAQILNISERTVKFHIDNAIKKLDTPNKTAAAVKAALLGLLN